MPLPSDPPDSNSESIAMLRTLIDVKELTDAVELNTKEIKEFKQGLKTIDLCS